MAINFNSLPDSFESNNTIPKGHYKGTVKKAEMRESKSGKAPYLNIQWEISDNTGKNYGVVFDIITEPEKDLTKYKLKRFILGLGLNITGDFELKDLAKIITGKSCGIDITVDNNQTPPRSVIDVFRGNIYYNLSEETEGSVDYGVDNDGAPVVEERTPFAILNEDSAPDDDTPLY